jgi:hypothetical protein
VTFTRLVVEDLEAPRTQTAGLFAGMVSAKERRARVEAVRRSLTTRYGPRSIALLGERPLPAREQRRDLIRRRREETTA